MIGGIVLGCVFKEIECYCGVWVCLESVISCFFYLKVKGFIENIIRRIVRNLYLS